MVEVRNRDVVPGETGPGASFEGLGVVCEVGDDYPYNLGREPAWVGRVIWGI